MASDKRLEKSRSLQRRAEAAIPGGVDSPVRAFRAVGGQPPFIARGEGARIWDADGNQYIDYVGSWGPLILGHAAPEVLEAVMAAARAGTSFGASTWREVELAEAVLAAYPAMEKVRFVNSGTEATMSAIRLARAATDRKRIVKFEGCYHGHSDSLLVKAGSGVATLGIPGSAGVPEEVAQLTLALPYNDLQALEKAFHDFPHEIACVMVEPVVGNMGCVLPERNWLPTLRSLTSKHGALLIFDEVMTGFRLALGGAQQLFGIEPDLTTLGKIIGGGLPVGAYGGSKALMDMVAPLGPVYQAGTLSGNPLAMAAGLATINFLCEHPEIYPRLEKLTATLVGMVLDAAKQARVPMVASHMGSMFTFFFTGKAVSNWASAAKCDTQAFARFHSAMLHAGIYFPPSQFEAAFLSAAHTEDDISATVAAAREALASVAGQ